jgi:hypothetical protein
VSFNLNDPGHEPFVAVYQQPCLVIVSSVTKKHCSREILRFGEQFSVIRDLPKARKKLDSFLVDHADSLHAGVGIVVIKRADGLWYVSPTRTLLRNASSLLVTMNKHDMASVSSRLKEGLNLFSAVAGAV